MDLPRDVDDYVKQTLDDSLGIPVSSQTLEAKLRASQDSQWRLRERLLSLLPQLKQKDQLIERFKLENECALYDKDREALMEFGNDADERAREAQSRVLDLERDLLFMENELNNISTSMNWSNYCLMKIIYWKGEQRLLRQHKERNHPDSGANIPTAHQPRQSNKRKSSPRTSSPMERKIDFDVLDSARQPLSPLHNSPDFRMHKK
ncbi:hypothetical protein E2542_SST03165 [Spatholobus suberectus]|nr:hypothetical protein E2542_SST03165 [Spatholobus suberectus]